MNKFSHFLADTVPEWMINSFPIVRIVLVIGIIIACICMVFCILMQPSNEGGNMGALSGDTDTYYSKHKEKTLQGALKRLTIVFATAIGVMIIAFFITMVLYNGTL